MDKQLLDSLSNLSIALEGIADALKSKAEATTATAKAIQGGDFLKQIKEINVGVKQLMKDSKKILDNQQTLLGMARDNKSSDVTSELGKDKKKQGFFKEGIGVIMLIAVAVLALGVAFKLIGNVNFLSVIALSISLPLLAKGFATVVTVLSETGFNAKKDGVNFVLTMVAISTGITLSSKILNLITPVGFTKLLTAILLGAGFALIAPSVDRIISALKGMSFGQIVKSVIFLPLILPAISLGIAWSSQVLQQVRPVSFVQMLTVIFISAAFTVIAFGLRKLITAFDGVGASAIKSVYFLPLLLPAVALAISISSRILQDVQPLSLNKLFTTIFIAIAFTVIAYGIRKLISAFDGLSPASIIFASLMMPLVLVAISWAIQKSSTYFSKIQPIGFAQFLTAVGISIVFVVISFAAKFIIKAIAEMKWTDVPKIPVFFVLVSIAIYESSKYIAKTRIIEISNMFKIAIYSVVLAIAVVAIGSTMALLNKLKVGLKDALVGGLLIVIISVAIMLSSHILSKGNYSTYPSFKWALGVGASLIAFSLPIIALGLVATTGIGLVAFLAGIPMVLGLAATIVEVSNILSKGNYENSGKLLDWALGTTLLFATFAPILLVLGAVGLASSVVSFFGPNPWEMAKKMMVEIANTIVDVSFVLSKGNYKDGPTAKWALGVALSLAAFSPVYAMLMANGVLKIFGGGGIGPEDFKKAIGTISDGIIYAAEVFASPKNKGVWKNGPSKRWAEGVGLAIGAFSPVLGILAQGSILELFGGKGVDAKAMKGAIKSISEGIVEAAEFFSKNSAPFTDNYPKKRWGQGVGAAIGAFAPVFKALHEDTGWFTSGDEVIKNMSNAITEITKAIVSAANILSGAKPDAWNSYPPKKWAESISKSVEGFLSIFDLLNQRDLTDLEDYQNTQKVLKEVISSITSTAHSIYRSRKYFEFTLDLTWFTQLKSSISEYLNVANYLAKNLNAYSVIGGVIMNNTVKQLVKTAGLLYNNRRFFSFKIEQDYMKKMTTNIRDFSKLAKELNTGGIKSGLKSFLGVDPVSQTAKGMIKMASAFDKLATSLSKFSSALKSIDREKIDAIRKLTGNIAILSSMDAAMFNKMMTVLESRSSVFGKMLDVQGRSGDMRARSNVGDRPGGETKNVWAKKSQDQGPMDSKGENALVKLDRIADLLIKINKVTVHLDEYLGFATDSAKKQEKQLKKLAKKDQSKDSDKG